VSGRLALAALLCLVPACGSTPAPVPAGRPARPNLLLVTIDTLRADALGCYGRGDAATPVLDALARRGVRYETAIAPAPLTGPSHASILTGLLPNHHGVRDNGGYVLPETVPTLPEPLQSAGYRTAGFVSGFPLARRFGFARGFQVFDDRFPRGRDPRRAPYVERDAAATTDAVLRWLEAPGEAPFFAWVHYYDPHAPYEPTPPFAERFAAHPYDGEVAFVDEQLGRLLSRLETKRLLARTVVLVTADHGESLGEHGEKTHGIFVYDSTVRVPLIAAGPGLPQGVVPRTLARSVDIAPTLLGLAGLRSPSVGDGRPLPTSTTAAGEPAYVESLAPLLHLGWSPLRAWRTGRWKLIDAPRVELYDLGADPGERHNVAAVHGDVVAELRRALEAASAAGGPAAAAAVDAETRDRLTSLGYLSGTAGAEAAPARGETVPRSGRKDPKDHLELLARLERGMSRFRVDPKGAVADLTDVLAQDSAIVIARRYRAIALTGAGRPAEALHDLLALEKAGVLAADDLVVRADCLAALKRAPQALQALRRATELQPRSPQPWMSRARLLARLGEDEQAQDALEQVLRLDPDHLEALRALGDLAAFHGETQAAAARYERVLALDPGDTGVAGKLAVVRGTSSAAGR
ncbi:MAG TPA: sulfatase-like hydrolase/transferase, partial [Vicinamibacteria bacterium]|nr:sulfatase-like hydrolase/transferase [Vicinamibacteria bacterium]